jgi:hypothetical protein
MTTEHPAVVREADAIYNAITRVDRHFGYEPEWKEKFRKHIAAAVERVCEPYKKAVEMYVTARRAGIVQSGSGISEYKAFVMMCELIDALNPDHNEVSK